MDEQGAQSHGGTVLTCMLDEGMTAQPTQNHRILKAGKDLKIIESINLTLTFHHFVIHASDLILPSKDQT